jgi:hypothetical protein
VKYMLLIYVPEASEPPAGTEPRDMDEAWISYDKAVADAGIRVAGDALHGPATATTVRGSGNGSPDTTDGPFAETREVLGGYYVLDLPDLDSALEWAGRCPATAVGGAVEVRPVVEFR